MSAMNAPIEKMPEKVRPKGDNAVHPATGEKLTRFHELNQSVECHESEYGPPSYPGRSLWEFNEDLDDFVYIRAKTEEEFQEDVRDYKKAMKEWSECNGIIRTPGPVTTTATFFTDSGREVEGQYDGEKWFWTRWEV